MHNSPNPPTALDELHLQKNGRRVFSRDGAASFDELRERLRPECEAIIAQYEDPRSALLPLMHLFQEHQGYVTQDAMRTAAEMLDISPAVVESTVSFYTLFFRKAVGKYMLQVCRGLMCQLSGADDVMAYFREKLGVGHLETTDDGLFSYEEVECLAACDRATCMQVNLEFVYDLTPAMIDEMIALMRAGNFHVKPRVQIEKPERTWSIKQDAQVGSGGKSPGTRSSTLPNNAGGVGDASGIIMLDRFLSKPVDFIARSKERTVVDRAGVIDALEEGNNNHAGH